MSCTRSTTRNCETCSRSAISLEQIFRDVIERGARLGAFATVDSFLDTKAIGAMAVRLPEWWTPDSVTAANRSSRSTRRYALKLVS